MKKLTALFALAFLAGCMSAPPPVKIARHILGRNAMKEARQKITGDDQHATPDSADPAEND